MGNLTCLLCAALFASGCGAIAAESRLQDLHKELDPARGLYTMETFARRWGPPDKRDVIGGTEYWTYITDMGNRRSGALLPVGTTGQAVFVGKDVKRYDKIVLEFRGGYFADWRATIQR